MGWKITTESATLPWTTAEVKDYLKVDDNEENTLIHNIIHAATRAAERYLNQAIITQTITEKLDRFKDIDIYLSVSPLQSVTSVSYKDSNNTSQTMSSGDYVVDDYSDPARLSIGFGKTWPTTYGNRNDVTIVYQAGYASESSGVPYSIRQAILLICADMYENRTDYVKRLPSASEYLLDQYRCQFF